MTIIIRRKAKSQHSANLPRQTLPRPWRLLSRLSLLCTVCCSLLSKHNLPKSASLTHPITAACAANNQINKIDNEPISVFFPDNSYEANENGITDATACCNLCQQIGFCGGFQYYPPLQQCNLFNSPNFGSTCDPGTVSWGFETTSSGGTSANVPSVIGNGPCGQGEYRGLSA